MPSPRPPLGHVFATFQRPDGAIVSTSTDPKTARSCNSNCPGPAPLRLPASRPAAPACFPTGNNHSPTCRNHKPAIPHNAVNGLIAEQAQSPKFQQIEHKSEASPPHFIRINLSGGGRRCAHPGRVALCLGLSGTAAHAGIVHGDDAVFPRGSLCVGTARMKKDVVQLYLRDTSVGKPTAKWHLIANDHAHGGAEDFAVDEGEETRHIFYIETGSRPNSIYVSHNGSVGFGTSPAANGLCYQSGKAGSAPRRPPRSSCCRSRPRAMPPSPAA